MLDIYVSVQEHTSSPSPHHDATPQHGDSGRTRRRDQSRWGEAVEVSDGHCSEAVRGHSGCRHPPSQPPPRVHPCCSYSHTPEGNLSISFVTTRSMEISSFKTPHKNLAHRSVLSLGWFQRTKEAPKICFGNWLADVQVRTMGTC